MPSALKRSAVFVRPIRFAVIPYLLGATAPVRRFRPTTPPSFATLMSGAAVTSNPTFKIPANAAPIPRLVSFR